MYTLKFLYHFLFGILYLGKLSYLVKSDNHSKTAFIFALDLFKHRTDSALVHAYEHIVIQIKNIANIMYCKL